jgi:hypothetical protein
MPLRRLTFLASLVLAVATVSPSAALAAANGTDRPLAGTASGTTTLTLATLAATAEGTGHIVHLGAFTGHFAAVFTITGASTFTYTGTGTEVAANGDELFLTLAGSGTSTPAGSESTETDTITGGTGRFAGASGMYTETISSVIVSVTATTETSRFTAALQGQISY